MKPNIVYTSRTMHAPVLQSIYARIDIIDYVDGSFVKSASVYMLGEHAKDVKDVKDISPSNKRLVSGLGVNTVKELIDSIQIQGGDDDWDDLDEMDFEQLLNTDTQQTVLPKKSASVKTKIIDKDVISSMTLYSKDKSADVREKIAVETNIKPYKQYLWSPKHHQSLNGDEISLMAHYNTSIREIEGYPIDARPLVINATETAIEKYAQNNVVILYCISVDSIVLDKNKLQFLANSDSEMLELIHNNTIQRFFPSMTRFVFSQYLSNEAELESKYKSYYFNKSDLLNKFLKQDELFKLLNKQSQVTVDSETIITASTTNITLLYQGDSLTLDTLRLFQMINIINHTSLAWIDLYRYGEKQRILRLRKMQQRDQYRKNISITLSAPIAPRELLNNKCIVFYYLPTTEYNELIVIINQNGSIWIKSKPNQSFTFSKAAYIEFISPIVNSLIERINQYEEVFLVNTKLPLLTSKRTCMYQIFTSSTNLTFKFPIAYNKLINLVIDKLLEAGIIRSSDTVRIGKGLTVFTIHYGITQGTIAEGSTSNTSEIEIKNVNETAVLGLVNLDVPETNLYVDLIGRLVLTAGDNIKLISTNQSELGLVDPVLFRPRILSDGYSRICQKKFQPVITTKDDKKAVEYFNFTFSKPEYYKCPTKDNPVLGFIQGKHEHGYCLPCCRKTPQAEAEHVRKTCIQNEVVEEDRQSSYKIDYPIYSIPNQKVMNRRIKLPDYVIQLFGGQPLVANGTIMASHGGIRDGMKPDVKSYLQSATILAAIDNGNEEPMYKSFREFIIDIIELLKRPDMHMQIMKNLLISSRFTTPSGLINILEDYYLKNTLILDNSSRLSAVELNDIIIFLANCNGMNILLLSDDRQSDIKLINISDVDVNRPVVGIIKRLNVEWSSHHQNTRALYLPITSNKFKVTHKSPLLIERIDIVKELTKIKRITIGQNEKQMKKQLTIENVKVLCANSKQYHLLDNLENAKMAVIGIKRNTLVITISSSYTTSKADIIKHKPTASISDLTNFITDYNIGILESTNAINKLALESYKQYLQVAYASSKTYQLLSGNAFFLKIHKLISHNNHLIGAIINVVEKNATVATELMFIKPVPISDKRIKKEVTQLCNSQLALHKQLNSKQILISPTCQTFIDERSIWVNWDVNPLDVSTQRKCTTDLLSSFHTGMYLNEIYTMLTIEVINAWKQMRPVEIEDYIISFIKKNKLPIPDTRVDTMIESVPFQNIDNNIFRITMLELFDKIKTFDKTNQQAIERVKTLDALNGYELYHIHKWTKAEVTSRVNTILKTIVVKSNEYPTFDLDLPITEQRNKFYKAHKLLIHTSIYDDIISFLIADLLNPFRKDYIMNLQLTMTALEDIRPHIGELIFVQQLQKP